MDNEAGQRPGRDTSRPNSPASRTSGRRNPRRGRPRQEQPRPLLEPWTTPITYPDLPVSARREEIAEALAGSQVLVLAGETGSGKTTQLPKLLLELGYGDSGLIGHTQPRRVAARAVADRIGQELGVPGAVAHQIRFTDTSTAQTRIKVMTDGILLAELRHDRDLRRYSALIIDEAHERSLNIDFLLGYCKRLLPRRPDLKLIVTSATIEPERFAEHFGGAPVMEISGRTYPVDVLYRPIEDEDEVTAICDSVAELPRDGDVLVFLSGEREIRDAAEALSGQLRHDEILPLFGRLSAGEQAKVFQPSATRRIVLATNVAETSITIPGIRYVIDPGNARISRYSNRTKVQRLPIEPISQASAQQRAGRCGRVSDGICIRLYSEEDFDARPRFTDPEILRTNLASVVLSMMNLRLGSVEAFPFMDPPDSRQTRDAIALLEELGAVTSDQHNQPQLTRLGRRMVNFPVDPRISRMILAAEANGCLEPVLILAAGMSIQDVRERPLDQEEQAKAAHARFKDPTSDFATLWNLWTHLSERQEALSSNQFRAMCRKEFLNYLRIREWQDLVSQLKRIARDAGMVWRGDETASAPSEQGLPWDAIHQSILTGLLSHIGLRDPERRDYLGARSTRWSISPGSALFGTGAAWVMAAELTETTKLWARMAARIDPKWIEPVAGHIVKRHHSEPHWEMKRAAAVALERVTLYGIPVVVDRKVDYGRIDPSGAREIFIRQALVAGEWRTHHAFVARNEALINELAELEERTRRRDIVADDEVRFRFYDERIPAQVTSGITFDRWWKDERRRRPDLLTFTPELLRAAGADDVSAEDFPTTWTSGSFESDLSYLFEPGHAFDGVSMDVPLAELGALVDQDLLWTIPGQREQVVVELLRSLPKAVRKELGPAPNAAAAILSSAAGVTDIRQHIISHIRRTTGAALDKDSFDLGRLPAHLRPTLRVLAPDGKVLATGKDPGQLAAALEPQLARTITAAAPDLERDEVDARSWATMGPLPESVTRRVGNQTVTGFPALVVEGDRVAVRVLPDAAAARNAHRAAVAHLIRREVNLPRGVAGRLDTQTKLSLGYNPHGGVAALLEDVSLASILEAIADQEIPRDAEALAQLVIHTRQKAPGIFGPALHQVAEILPMAYALANQTDPAAQAAAHANRRASLQDIHEQVGLLVSRGFVTRHGLGRLRDLERYLRAAAWRLERLAGDPARDAAWMAQASVVEQEYREARGWAPADTLDAVFWAIQELRVSLFAQHLRSGKVSVQRIQRMLDEARDSGR